MEKFTEADVNEIKKYFGPPTQNIKPNQCNLGSIHWTHTEVPKEQQFKDTVKGLDRDPWMTYPDAKHFNDVHFDNQTHQGK